jgi:transposase
MEWFDKKVSSNLYLPLSAHKNWTTSTTNKHFKHDKYCYSKPNVKIKSSETIKKVKKEINYTDKIKKIQEQLNNETDEDIIKKLNTKIKSYNTKLNKQTNNKNKITKIYTVSIPFNNTQKQTLRKWFSECLKIYNACIDYNNKNKNDNNVYEYTKLKLLIFEILYKNSKKPVPYDTLTDEVRLFCCNLKSCLSNKKAGNIDRFELKYRHSKLIQSIFISKKSITKSGIFPTILKSIDNWENIYKSIVESIGNIDCDCRLVYDKVLNKFLLKIPYNIECTSNNDKQEIVSLDPGEKIFITYYSLDNCGRLGHDIRIPILEQEKKIRRFQRILGRNKNKSRKKLRNKTKIKNKIQRKHRKITNIVKELHNQTANYLTKTYKTILIPTFETKNMVNTKDKLVRTRREILKSCNSLETIKVYKRKSRLNSRVKFCLMSLSHYKFRQHLSNKCQEQGCKLLIVDESYTSQCCGNCGKLDSNYNNRVKKCSHCSYEIDRDVNGARNILIKNWTIL